MDSTDTNTPEPVAPEIGTRVAADSQRRFPCKGCGAQVSYAPGTTSLKCPYCSFDNPIEASAAPIVEYDFVAALDELESTRETTDRLVSHCDSCGANVQFPANVTSLSCPFCGRDVVAARASTKLIKPHALLPFGLDERAARERYRNWLRSLWFAPSTLKDFATLDTGLVGVYLPYWTYDCAADTDYSGMRGDDYWVTETYTATVNGRPTRQTRQVRRTRWTPVSGRVHNQFNDVLVNASGSITESRAQQLEPWDLAKVTPYADDYLAGFRAESYAMALKDGFGVAQQRMEPKIVATIHSQIGGDHQRITGKQSRYDQITFKHILLPVWTSAYRYHGKVYNILVNARTGEVIGERPWSAWKITGLVLAILAAIIVVLLATTVFGR